MTDAERFLRATTPGERVAAALKRLRPASGVSTGHAIDETTTVHRHPEPYYWRADVDAAIAEAIAAADLETGWGCVSVAEIRKVRGEGNTDGAQCKHKTQ